MKGCPRSRDLLQSESMNTGMTLGRQIDDVKAPQHVRTLGLRFAGVVHASLSSELKPVVPNSLRLLVVPHLLKVSSLCKIC